MNVCDLCIYNPPSSYDGKPCTMCPATTNMTIEQKPETVTEFADRCRECGAKYGKLLKQKTCENTQMPERVDVDEEIKRSYKKGYLNAIHDISKALRELYAVKDTELDECVTRKE